MSTDKQNTTDTKDPKQKGNHEKESILAPDEETLHTTDPQEHMKGPISSVMQGIKETAEDTGGETPADDKENK